jgi:predicted nucleic acid-binding protein
MADLRVNYMDTSALVKLHVKEDWSQEVQNYFNRESVFLTTSMCLFDALQVIGRKFKKDKLTQDKYLSECEELLAMVRNETIEIHDVNIFTPETFNEVERLVKLYDKGKKQAARRVRCISIGDYQEDFAWRSHFL